MARVFIGTSGWVYPHWRERFYPRGFPQTQWLQFYARQFPTVEINNSFYRLPSIDVFRGWHDRTPNGFIFAVKASRYITHIRRLRGTGPPVRRFLRRARHLGQKLGPVLFQLPPRFPRDLARLDEFLGGFPRTVTPVLEFRDPSWHVQEVFDLLDHHRAAYCIMVSPALKCERVVTGSILYVRFHAPGGARPAFGRARLRAWATHIMELMRRAREGYVYFNNDVQGAAIDDATILRELLEA